MVISLLMDESYHLCTSCQFTHDLVNYSTTYNIPAGYLHQQLPLGVGVSQPPFFTVHLTIFTKHG